MKMKVLLGLVVALVVLFAVLWRVAPPGVPVQVSGGLSERDVASIRGAVRTWMTRKPILPDFSLKSLRAAPGLFMQRCREPRIWKVEKRNDVFVAVTGRVPRETQPQPYILWSVFMTTNGWRVESEYRY